MEATSNMSDVLALSLDLMNKTSFDVRSPEARF
jgi:hypothetical protein